MFLAVDFDPQLPISEHLAEIAGLLRQHQVLVVAGETGSGKTTQLPKLCLQAGLAERGMIGHTQPRRLAARAVAARIAEELQVPLGGPVGYAVRFSDQTGADTRIKVMTDGLLLTEFRHDRLLRKYQVLIIDEAHERSLNIDFLLGAIKRILPKRPDLRVIITSATIDVDAFSRFFQGAPVVQVGGRSYPVAVQYMPEALLQLDSGQQLLWAVDQVRQMPLQGAGDVLIFFSGEREILEAARLLRKELGESFDILPLYARLPAAEQQRIFSRGSRRRLILTTNVAETSLTVPNIGFVIDTGLVRISRYSFQSKLQRLPVEPISQASADQRAGRCGRIAPGTCVRLYTEADFAGRPAYTDPEILRTNLAAVVLQMRVFGFGDPFRFPFLDIPDARALKDAQRLLQELGAFDAVGQVTSIGRQMAQLPVDPRLARILLAAAGKSALQEALIIVSGLAIQDPRERPLDKQQQADQAHRQFQHEQSDFLGYVQLWQAVEQQRQQLSRAQLERFLRQHFLSPNRVREWRELHRQLRLAMRELGFRENVEPAAYSAVHQALIAGLLSLAAMHLEKGEYLAPRQLKCRIFPGSALFKRQPKWLIAAEITETQRVYARCVAAVEAGWLEAAGGHLLKRSYAEPHWDAKRGEVMAYERVSLYGLPLVERRRVRYDDKDPALCHALFLRDGLLAGAIQPMPEFLQHNLRLIARVREQEAQARRRDLLAPDEALLEFYQQRIPTAVCSRDGLRRWLATQEASVLRMSEADVQQQLLAVAQEAYPSQLLLAQVRFALKYSFAPGAPEDGISIQVPLGLLGHLQQHALDWLVPGFLEEKCEALLRGLPKSLRKVLAPVPDKLRPLLPELLSSQQFRQGNLLLVLATMLAREYQLQIPLQAWPTELPPHLRMNIQVRDQQQRLLAQGRDLARLQQQFAAQASAQLAQQEIRQHGLTSFPVAGLPVQQLLETPQGPLLSYPALQDEGDTVALVLADSPAQAGALSAWGYVRLVLMAEAPRVKQWQREIANRKQLVLAYAPLGSLAELQSRLLAASIWHSFFPGLEPGGDSSQIPLTADAFNAALAAGQRHWPQVVLALIQHAEQILSARQQLVQTLAASTSPAYAVTVADIQAQLASLVPPDFLVQIPLPYLAEVSRYLEAANYRLLNLQGKVAKDVQLRAEIAAFVTRIQALTRKLGVTGQTMQLRFALEEYRVALFAQQLRGKDKISAQRLEKLLVPLEQQAGIR